MERDTDTNISRLGAGTGRRVSNELRAYWEALRAGRPMPSRAEIDPRGIDRALAFAFILERVAPGIARFRLAGMHLNDLMGMEVRGMPLTSFFTPEARKGVAELTEAVFASPAIAEAQLSADRALGRPLLSARLLILPLTSDFGDVSRALGCLVAEGEIGRSPRRFELIRSQTRLLPTTRPMTPAQLGPDPLRREALRGAPMGFAEAQARFEPPRKTPAEHLTEMTPEERRAMFRVVRES
ncbi:hypothetical protein BMI90_09630 [Thioclava sp. L04-15]|uniref:PAS domain-containing protein n=1 Tax=Thioclava sp. L04-15 TaxID=1915318 RepID=UPI0009976F75|nr:PAS domain-containing protein [Thioclava sp. L04-15]OOY28131.1 hypothetical protein BMI90_09630 [Thioclava sp. L04-15]TNE83187.1 MAG: PAS domain-containing protein [Paracoccaceae bacterium]